MTEKLCPSCQRPLPDDAPAGLCPVCALSAAREPDSRRPLPPLEEVQAAFPQFEILECIGHGGMGVVYKIRQRQLDRVLALKILLPGLHTDPGFTVRFEREAKALARLSHPGIVAIYDYGETEGFCWLTMEYVEGVNLRQAMQAARFTPEQALALIPELCAALQYAHSQGVLHRDIKPENILLDAAGRVKIVDFGIVRLVDDESTAHTVLTYTGSALGSPAYAAPEQIEQPHRVDHRADLYSLGVVLYEMLTGELPLGRFPAPSRKSNSHPDLDPVVFRTLEKEPAERYQSAEELKKGVEGASAAKMPASPAPVPQRRRVTSFPDTSSIRPVWLIVAIVVLALLALAIGGGLLVLVGMSASLEIFFKTAGIFAFLAITIPGIAISWYHLNRARAGLTELRPIALFFGVWLPLVVAATLLSMYGSAHPLGHSMEKGGYLLNVLRILGELFAVSLPLFWLSRVKGNRSKRKGWLVAVLAILSTSATLTFSKRVDGRWPFANFYGGIFLGDFPQPLDWQVQHAAWLKQGAEAGKNGDLEAWRKQHPAPDSPFVALAQDANAAFGGRLVITNISSPGTSDGSQVKIGLLAKDFSAWTTYAKALMDRFENGLPPESAVVVKPLFDQYVTTSADGEFYRGNRLIMQQSFPPWNNVWVLLAASACGVLIAWCLAGGNVWPMAWAVSGWTALYLAPVWIRPGDLEEKILSGPPPAAQAFQLHPVFTTPWDAAQTALDAAWAGNEEVFRNALDAPYAETLERKGGVAEAMSNVSGSRLWAMRPSPYNQKDLVKSAYELNIVRGDGMKGTMILNSRGDEWKVARLPENFRSAL